MYLKVEEFARARDLPRSKVFSDAVAEYLERHDPDRITDRMNTVRAHVGESDAAGPFVERAARSILNRTEW
ncbi:MAG: hypothetical protein PF508_17215 [Spirochaeta sp.]|nr:hypothetical protein [Spirochaeta sp.]